MHEFEQLVDHGLQKLPMCLEESRVLANDVHNIGGHDRFVVLASLIFAQSQKVFDDCDKESLFQVLTCESISL
jgi:hypothetical protein